MHRFTIPCLLLFVTATPAQENRPVVFKDVSEEMELHLGGGAACWVDVDNDGWVDVIAGNLWKNNGGKSFSKVEDVVPGSAITADFDNDGFADIFSWSSLKLWRNKDGKQFTEVELPKLPRINSRGALWADFNNDGFVDLFIGGYEGSERSMLLLINVAGNSFRIERSEGDYATRGVTACDFDQDGDVDVYVSNYRLQPNLLWLNDPDERLANVAAEYNVIATKPGFGGGHSIGASWGDFDNDGLIDLFAGNFAHVDGRGDQPKSRFLRNLGERGGFHFADIGTRGVHYQESYASTSAGDYDNDGNLDLFFTTVYGVASFGRRNNSVLFRNDGKCFFKDVTATAQLAGLPPTYQAAWADYDNDGDLDLATAGKLFQNLGTPYSWLKVRLTGDGKQVNRSAIGAQVRIKVGDKILTRQVEAGTGEGNQNEPTLHFGLGEHQGEVTVQVAWPKLMSTGARSSLTVAKVNELVEIEYQPE